MAKKTSPLLPSTEELLHQFGDRLRLARLRRRLPARQVAERAGMSPMTLRSLERGGSGVTMGAYLSVMQVLGIESDLGLLGKADPQGRELQDAQLPARTRATSHAASPLLALESSGRSAASLEETPKGLKSPEDAKGWIQKNGFASSEALAALIAAPKKRAR